MAVLAIIAVAVVSFLAGYWTKIDIYRSKVEDEQRERIQLQSMYGIELDRCRGELEALKKMLGVLREERNEHNGKA